MCWLSILQIYKNRRKLLNTNNKEQLNRVELRGTFVSVNVKDFENTKVAIISVATNFCSKDRKWYHVVETTWHQVDSLRESGKR